MTLKISFSEVRAAQRVVAEGITEMNALTRQILAQSGLSQAAMQAPAGRVTAETYTELGGGGRALAEALDRLHGDLGRLQVTAAEGSDEATRIASSASVGGTAHAVAAGM